MPNEFQTWDEWRGLTDDQRDYELYQVLRAIDKSFHHPNGEIRQLENRVCKLENRKWVNTTSAFLGSVLGGIIAFLGIVKFKLFGG